MLVGSLFGGFCGVAVGCCTNALVKRRYFATPWMHLGLAGLFGYMGSKHSQLYFHLLDSVNQNRVLRGMPPIERVEFNELRRELEK